MKYGFFCLKSSNLNVETLPGTSVSLCGTGRPSLETFVWNLWIFMWTVSCIWNLRVDPIFNLCGSFKCGTVECDWVCSLSGEPFSGTFISNLYVELACGNIVWKLCMEPLFGNLGNQNVEPCEPGTEKCGIIIGNLGKPEAIYCAEPLSLLSVETFCGTILWRSLWTFMWNPAKPGARFPAAATNHPEASLEEPQAFQTVGWNRKT